ncbi:MAG: cytochrome b/b6 domain-containing protein [Pseudomonadota bacterium]
MADKRLVWDLPLRLFHWVLVLSLLASYLTAKGGFEYMQYHFWLGYWMIGLIVFRIIWGFVGPRHARFASFFPGPGKLGRYLTTILRSDSAPTVGHNPAGGVMVLLMLLMVGAQAGSGLFVTDDVAWAGPYNPAVSEATAGKLTWFHHLNFDVLIWVLALHVIAILFYAVRKKQNLVGPMLHGHKHAHHVPEHEAIPSSEVLKALIVALLCAAAVYGLINFAPEPPEILY